MERLSAEEMKMSARKPKWYPPPPPVPKVLHLPRRAARRSKPAKQPAAVAKVKAVSAFPKPENSSYVRGKLESLFDQERVFSRPAPVVLLSAGDGETLQPSAERGGRRSSSEIEGEKWKLQAEFLRAECSFLRMEREVALKKLERYRVQMEKALQSAVHTLISERNKMFEGGKQGALLEKEIEELEEKLQELHKRSRAGQREVHRCCNFDKKASILRRRIEKLEMISEEKQCVREIREMAEASLRVESSSYTCENQVLLDRTCRLADVEAIRRQMEVLSKGMSERMEEYGNLLGSAGSSSASALKRTDFSETEILQQAPWSGEEEGWCSGRCKAIVSKIVEQVRSETEQWSQMQVMLTQVREEMEELHASRALWQNRAVDAQDRLQTAQGDVREWRRKAQSSEAKALELEKAISKLQIQLDRLRSANTTPSAPAIASYIENAWGPARIEDVDKVSLDSLREKEKRVLVCRLKEKQIRRCEDGDRRRRACSYGSRAPLQEIGNASSPLFRRRAGVFVSSTVSGSENHACN